MTKVESWAQRPLPRRLWWPWDQQAERVGFATSFIVASPAEALWYLSASGTYQAWLDGSAVLVPDSPSPSWRVMHRIAVPLVPGTHELRIEASPGAHSQPFFLCCLDWVEMGVMQRVATDATWQMTANPTNSWQLAASDSSWRAAWAFDGVWAEPWAMPCNAPDDFCRLSHGWQTVAPERVRHVIDLCQGLTSVGASAALDGAGVLRFAPAKPFASGPPTTDNTRPHHLWEYTHKALAQAQNAWLELFAGRAPYAILDLGSETFGRVCITLRSGGPAVLAISTGESLFEVQRYSRRFTDIFTVRNGETFSTTPAGFRFITVTALGAGAPELAIEPVEVQHIRFPAVRVGSFSCDDEVLTKIWELSAHTMWLCLQNEVWDGIKRDQRAWMGDLWTEALAAYHVFDDARLTRHTLAVLAELGPGPARSLPDRRYPGLWASWKTTTGDINDIPSYTLWWVVGLHDYVRYTGDVSLCNELADDIEATLMHVAGWVGDDAIWRFKSGWDFVDWAPLSADERSVFCHLLACQVMILGAELLETAGRSAEVYRTLQARMVYAARAAWWRDGDPVLGGSHHLHAMGIRSGVLSTGEASRLFELYLESDPPMSMTYWHRYADLDAARRVGKVQWGLDYVRRYWGQALQIGMTTLWEAFDAAWIGGDPHGASMIGAEFARYGGYETSLCHGWSAGPAVWLHEAVLGVRPAKPGFGAIEFSPSLGDLEWADGTVPTPYGPISVQLRRGANMVRPHAQLTLPSRIDLRIPASVRETWDLETATYSRP